MAVTADGRYGTQSDQNLCIASRLPADPGSGTYSEITACNPSVSPPAAVFALTWDANVDLDLHVITPSGLDVNPKIPLVDPIDAGETPPKLDPRIDRDSIAFCVPDGWREEDLAFPTLPASGSTYQIRANLFSACGLDSVTFTVTTYEAVGTANVNRQLVQTSRQSGTLTSIDADGDASGHSSSRIRSDRRGRKSRSGHHQDSPQGRAARQPVGDVAPPVPLSVLSIGAMVERWLFFRNAEKDVDELGDKLSDLLERGDQEGAQRLLDERKTIEASVLARAIRWVSGGPESLADAIDGEMTKKRKDLERGMNLLGTLGNNAPFVGLLGTVIGVIQAFNQLGAGQDKAAMANVMGGIAEALVATGRRPLRRHPRGRRLQRLPEEGHRRRGQRLRRQQAARRAPSRGHARRALAASRGDRAEHAARLIAEGRSRGRTPSSRAERRSPWELQSEARAEGAEGSSGSTSPRWSTSCSCSSSS